MNFLKRLIGGLAVSATAYVTNRFGAEVGAAAGMAIGYIVSHVFHAMPSPNTVTTGNP